MNLKKSSTRTLKRRCVKCGVVGYYKPRERHCKAMERNALGKSGYWCYGALEPVTQKPRVVVTLREAIQRMVEQGEIDDRIVRERGVEHREKAARQLEQVRRRIAKIDRSISRLRTRRKKWSDLVRRLTKLAAMSDFDVQAVQVRKVRKRIRGIAEPPAAAAPV